MKVEHRIILTAEELDTINEAYEILEKYHAECIRVNDPFETLRSNAQNAYQAIDNFLCEYSDQYEK